MSDMNIPKIKANVEIAFKDGGVIKNYTMTLFLNKFSAHHSGEETIEEVLNDKYQFIPAIITDDKETFSILNIDSVFYVKETEEISEADRPTDLCVQFITGEKMELAAYEDLPEYKSRAIDFLNGDHSFLTFLKDRRRIFINKNKINKVEVL